MNMSKLEKSIWFETQTGIIRDHKSETSNFHQFELPESQRMTLDEQVSNATVGSGGLEYKPEFYALLPIWERQWRQRQQRERR